MENGKPVLVTTEKRGVFFGYVADASALPASIRLTRCRNCVYWSADVRGFVGLAANGPSNGCRIGHASAETTLYGITSVSAVSPDATIRWELAPWK